MIARFGATIVFFAGVALAAALAVHAGFDAIGHSLAAIGWARLAVVCGLHLASQLLCALAWWCVGDGISLRACCVARWIRDGASNLVGFIPAIGETISARALSVFGSASAGKAAASTIVDVGIEALAQALYTVVGLLLLLGHLDVVRQGQWLLITVVAVIPVLLLFGLSRHAGALRTAERWGVALARRLGLGSASEPLNLADAVAAIQRLHGRVLSALAVHLAAWTVGAVQVWIVARGLDHPLDFPACVALASLVCAARSAFFLVPWAAGVQEGGFLLVGAALGMDASSAVALSLTLRARDVLVGAPAVLVWYIGEGRRGMRRRAEAG